MPRNRLVAKILDFLFRDADPPHGLGHLADDAEVIAGTIKSHKHLGIFRGHREGPCADMLWQYVGGRQVRAGPRKRTSAFSKTVEPRCPRRARPVRRGQPFRDDPFEAHLAGVPERPLRTVPDHPTQDAT
jgi:hypothetical protein